MKKLADKIRITIACQRDYGTVYSKSIEVVIPETVDGGQDEYFRAFNEAFIMVKNEFTHYTKNVSASHLLFELNGAVAALDAKNEEAKKHEKDGEGWRLRAQLDESQKELARLKCQLDGLIKSVNPTYKPFVENGEVAL